MYLSPKGRERDKKRGEREGSKKAGKSVTSRRWLQLQIVNNYKLLIKKFLKSIKEEFNSIPYVQTAFESIQQD